MQGAWQAVGRTTATRTGGAGPAGTYEGRAGQAGSARVQALADEAHPATDPAPILLVCPSAWDSVQLAATRSDALQRRRLLFAAEEAEDAPHTFDALAFVDQTVHRYRSGGIGGVASASDYPGAIVAAAIAQHLGLPGPAPDRVLACSHKYYSRLAQRAAAPEATPRFALVDPNHPSPEALAAAGLTFPLFVKPVKSWFSILAEPIDTFASLQAFLARPDVHDHLGAFVRPFNALVERYSDFDYDGSYLIAEDLLRGTQVTVEGYVSRGDVQIVGVVDSVMFPGTKSFERFDYPSSLPASVQQRMGDVVRRVVGQLGLDSSLFNVELFHDPATDRVAVIEVNPRMCGQFADLMESVNGTNTYEVLLALASGERPACQYGAGRFRVAASFPLRAFADHRVAQLPDAQQVEEIKRAFPVTLVKSGYYRVGQRLSDLPENSDGVSYRYGVVNMAGDDLPSMLADFAEVRRRLSFVLEPAG
jgi:hypothetical protein